MTESLVDIKKESLFDIRSKFDDFVQKYTEFCIDKVLTPDSKTFLDNKSNSDMIDIFVKREIPIDSSAYKDNCLDGLNDVSEIIEKLFESEETFIKAMDSDIAEFNKLYNCWKYGNLDDPGIKPQELKENSGSGRDEGGGGVSRGEGRGGRPLK